MEPAYEVRMVCLANSRKISGRCVAGKIVSGTDRGKWVRPVSARETAELSELDRRYEKGADPKLLEIIDIPMLKPLPHGFQVENQLIDDRFYWSTKQSTDWAGLHEFLDKVEGPLWENRSSGGNGQNDRVAEDRALKVAENFGGSLALVKVADLAVTVALEGAGFDNAKRKVRGTFTLAGHRYTLSITDVPIERTYLEKGDGRYKLGEAILCISLGEPFHDYAYKLIAAVHLPPST